MTESKKTRKPRPTYYDQFKRDAVKLLAQPGYTLAKASAALGVSQTARSNWKKSVLPRESADLVAENARLLRRLAAVQPGTGVRDDPSPARVLPVAVPVPGR